MPVQAPFILQATPEEFQSPPYAGIEPHYLGEASRTLIEKVRVRARSRYYKQLGDFCTHV